MMMRQCPLELIHKTYHIGFFFSASTQRGMGSLQLNDFTQSVGEGVTIVCFNDVNEGRRSSSHCRHCHRRAALDQGCYPALVFCWAASRCLQKGIKEDTNFGRISPQNVFKSWTKWEKKTQDVTFLSRKSFKCHQNEVYDKGSHTALSSEDRGWFIYKHCSGWLLTEVMVGMDPSTVIPSPIHFPLSPSAGGF